MEPALPAGSCVASANRHPEPSPLAGVFLWRSYSVDSLQLMFRAPRAWDSEIDGLRRLPGLNLPRLVALKRAKPLAS